MKKLFHILIFLILISCFDCLVLFSYEFSNQFTINYGDRAIALDNEHGFLYILNTVDNQIDLYNLQGNKQFTFADSTIQNNGIYQFYAFIDLIVDEKSDVYILAVPYKIQTDGFKNYFGGFSIINLNSNGELLKEFNYSKIEKSWSPNLLAYKKSILYITDGSRLKKINAENGLAIDYIFPIQNSTDYNRPYIHSTDMAIDNDNNIWLVGQDIWDISIDSKVGVHMTRFDSNCQNQKTFIAKSKSSFFGSALNRPGICFDSDNNMYLATCYGQSIEIYDFDQEFQHEILIESERSLPVNIAIDNNKNLYILDGLNDRVLIYELKD